jgi:catechol 2,3-dioxygenase-like lactoylglutathione lyase family enzyme
VLVTGAQAAPKSSGLRAVSLNHVTVRVPDVQRTSSFYQEFFGMPLKQHSATTHILGVGKSFFGIEQKGNTAALDHYDFGIAGFNADDVTAKLKERNFETGARRVEGVVQVPGPRRIRCSSEFTRL